jgi:hypothetical protein
MAPSIASPIRTLLERQIAAQTFHLTEQLKWPARMPREGTLEVDFHSKQNIPDTKIPVSDAQFEHLCSSNLSEAANVSDTFRVTFSAVCSICISCFCVACASCIAHACRICVL